MARPRYPTLPKLVRVPCRNQEVMDYCREQMVDGGDFDRTVEYPDGSGQYVWWRYDDEKAKANGFANYGEDGALDAYLSCGLAVPYAG